MWNDVRYEPGERSGRLTLKAKASGLKSAGMSLDVKRHGSFVRTTDETHKKNRKSLRHNII